MLKMAVKGKLVISDIGEITKHLNCCLELGNKGDSWETNKTDLQSCLDDDYQLLKKYLSQALSLDMDHIYVPH